MKRNKGITLIALVITIIVLLILAGVSISLILGENGILNKAQKATVENRKATAKEEVLMAWASAETDYLSEKNQNSGLLKNREFYDGKLKTYLSSTGHNISVENGETAGSYIVNYTSNDQNKQYTFTVTANGIIEEQKIVPEKTVEQYPVISANVKATENSKYLSGEYTAIIPKGFTVSNIDEEKSIESGLVVVDENENEWVWIPVSSTDFNNLYETAEDDGWTMDGTNVKTKYKTKANIVTMLNDDWSGRRNNPGDNNGYREPDVLNNDQYGDAKDLNNISLAGLGSTVTEMAIALKDDYKVMLDSLEKYGGFYVGRYELSNVGVKKDEYPLVGENWYSLYAKCKTLGNGSINARMIFGCQWDQVCKFMITSGDKVALEDYRTYGNYGTSGINTGSNESYKINNIYDFAGNCYEWTLEAFSEYCRVFRGGRFSSYGDVGGTITHRGYTNPNSTSDSITSRPTLYIK